MADILIRQGATGATGVKNAPLTIAELDQNFTNLNTFKVEQNTNGAVIPAATGATGVAGYFRYNPATQQFQGYGPTGWGEIGGGLDNWTQISSNTNAVSGTQYLTNTSGGQFTLTLPATPPNGATITIADAYNWSVNNLVVARNGSTIDGAASDLILDVQGVLVTLVYTSTTWRVYTVL
jgi:hypothetical protein